MSELIMWIIYFSGLYFAVFWLIILIIGDDREKKVFTSWPKVSVVIPAYNEEEHIAECIQSILNLDYPKDKLEVIAVNDGSTDNTLGEIQKFADKIKIVDLKVNKGTKAVPVNIGLGKTSGEYVACLDSDSIVAPEALKKMLPAFYDDNVAAVTPALKVMNPTNLIEKLQWLEYLFAIFLRKLQSLIDSIYVTPGPFTVFRRDVLEKVGYFEEDNITEDMEMALRLQENHYRIENVEDADVFASSPRSLWHLYQQRRRWYEGLLINSYKYKSFAFNMQYGDFAILMPSNVLSVFVLMASTGLFTYYTFKPIFEEFMNLYLIDFDLLTYFNEFTFNLIFLDIDYTKTIVIIAVTIMGLITLVLSHKMGREKVMKFGIKPLIIFLMFYFIFLGYMWLGVMARFLFGTKKSW